MIAIGDRVQLHPATDWWMRGARYGEIVHVGKQTAMVQLDGYGRPIRVRLADILEVIAD